jgi:hypothetical protein
MILETMIPVVAALAIVPVAVSFFRSAFSGL